MNDDALKSLTNRAESGNADAQYELALLILDESTPDDMSWEVDCANGKALEKGTRWLVVAARNGSREAQTDLAKRYHYGIDFPENQTKAFEWFMAAADNDCAEAQFFLGELYTADDIVSYDIETALEWYERSAKNGYQWAQLALFDIFRNGADLSVPDLEKALHWGRKAGEQGNLPAQVSLGRMFFEGEIVERNPMEAAFWLHLACDLDDEAKYLLATLYFNGHGVEKNITKSAELFRSLARKGDTDAMVQLAMVLSEMFRPPHDEIHSWLIKASELGHFHAREMLEEIEASDESGFAVKEEFQSGDGPPRTASQWRALAEAGDAEAQFCLARMLEDGRELQGDYEEAVRWYRRAANQGHVGALWHLSACYQSGLGVKQNEDKALELLQRAANGGNSDAQLQLGWQYYFGSIVPEDKKKAFQLFKKASEQWNLNALVWQGHCYQHGTGVVSDRRKACELYRKAADLGVLSAQFKLGMMYLNGLGVRQNSEEAARWFALAANSNHTGALVELGRMFLTADGVDESHLQAETVFRKAAELGDAEAKFELGRLLLMSDDDEVHNAVKHIVEAAQEDVLEAQLYLGSLFHQGHGEHKQDLREAAKWYLKAVERGDEVAKQRLAALRSKHPAELAAEEPDVSSVNADSDMDQILGQIIANKFAILSRLGGDKFGAVYKARNVFSDRIVSIKMLSHQLRRNDVAIQRFQREAKAISRLDHQNLIRLHDFGITSGEQPYMVLDFVKGLSLEELLKQDGPFDVERCISLFLQIVDGLAIAHDAGIVHRDIRPGNIILIDAKCPLELAKVVDFGIARLFSEESELDPLSRTGRIEGMPSYLSPEQCQGQALDSRSDIYSLGCVLFEALTGSRAVSGTSFFEILCSHLYQPPPSIMEACPEANFSHQLDAMIRRMMAKDPNFRYQDLHALKEELLSLRAAAA